MTENLDKFDDSGFTGKTLIIKELKDEIKELEIKARAITTELDERTELLKEAKEKRKLLTTLVQSTTEVRGSAKNRKSNTYIERATKLTVGNRLN